MPVADLTVGILSGGTKDSAVITESVVQPLDGTVTIGFQQVDNARKVEIVQGVKQLRDFLIEQEVLSEGADQIAEIPIGGTKAEIGVASPIVSPAAGGVIIQIGENYPAVGNEIFHSDIATLIAAMCDLYLKGV